MIVGFPEQVHPQFDRTYRLLVSFVQVSFSTALEEVSLWLILDQISVNCSYCSFKVMRTKSSPFNITIPWKKNQGKKGGSLIYLAYTKKPLSQIRPLEAWMAIVIAFICEKADNFLKRGGRSSKFCRDQKSRRGLWGQAQALWRKRQEGFNILPNEVALGRF